MYYFYFSEMISQISISYLNVNGFHNSRLGCKSDTADLVNNIVITRYDISKQNEKMSLI